MNKTDIILSRILDVLFMSIFYYIFLIIGEIIHRNYLGFYGLLLFILVNMFMLLDNSTLGMKIFNLELVSLDNKDIDYITLFTFEFINIIFDITVVFFIIDMYYLLFIDKSDYKTLVSNKLNIKYARKEINTSN